MQYFLKMIQRLTNLGVPIGNAVSSSSQRKRIKLLNIVAIIAAIVGFTSIPYDYYAAPTWMVAEDIISFLFYIFVPILNKHGRYQLARFSFLFFTNTIIVVDSILLGPETGINLVFFAICSFSLMLFNLSEKILMFLSALIPIVAYFALQITFLSNHTYFIYSSFVSFAVIWAGIYFLHKTNDESETALKEIRAQVIQTEKLAALGQMSSGLAHEINTPLMALTLNISLLKSVLRTQEHESKKTTDLIEKINNMASRIARITHSLQSYARVGEMDPKKPEDLNKIIEDTVEFCKERFRTSNIELKIKTDKEALNLNCKSVQVSQVLINLLNNSFDAVVDDPKTGKRWIEIEAHKNKNKIAFSVTDSGTGIPKNIQDKLFVPFFTTKPTGKGTGLGLSVSKGLVENHGGQIFLDAECKNTRIVAEFPI